MATNITIDETITNVSISGVAETTPAYTTITLSNEQGAQGPTGATGTVGVDAGELTNTGTSTAAQLGLATAGTVGTYTKVTTDTFGRVSSGTTLSATDIPNLDASKITGTAVINSDSRLTDSRTPSGSAGGDLTGTYPNPTLASAGTAGTYTKVTTDSKGRVTSGTTLSAGDVPTLNQSTTGNADTATALQTSRTINGVSFNGTANITVADATKAPLTGATFTGQTSVQSTSSSVVPLFVKPTGSLTITGLTATHSGGAGVTFDTISGFSSTVGLVAGQSVVLDTFSDSNFNGTTTITVVSATTIRVTSLQGTNGSGTGGQIVVTATQQNLQEWQYNSGTAVASVGASGIITASSFSGSGASLTSLSGANLVSGSVTADKLSSTAVAPTFWYSPTVNYTTGTLTALTAVDPFGLTNGVTVGNSKTYFVDYLITGSIASTGSTSGSLRLTMAGDAVGNFNFITQQSGALSSSPNFNWTSANDYEAFINATTSNFQVGGTLAPAGTAQQFQLRFTGILRTSVSGSYFQPKIALSAVSGTTITVNRESFASLLEIGTSATTSLGTWA